MSGPNPEDVIYYITLYNENYLQPPFPGGETGDQVREGIIRGLYRFAPRPEPTEGQGNGTGRRATLLFSGTAWSAVMEARDILWNDYGVAVEAWSATSYKALREDALSTERWNRLHPGEAPRTPWVTQTLSATEGPMVAVTDFLKAVPDQIARWVPAPFVPLGTDGFGLSDTREALRRHFEVDAPHVVVATLAALAELGEGKAEEVADAISRFGLDPEAPDPRVAQ
jgi:pyruvate dehydrogenase E1 component